jgi:uncharacterized protein (TIGR04255 family)
VNAPATEALIDLEVDAPPGLSLVVFEQFARQIGSEYPERHERMAVSGSIVMGPAKDLAVQSSGRPDGLLLRSADGLQVVQVRFGGFTFSRLKPYQTWEALRSEARRLWTLYTAVARPLRVTRVGVRYVNRIALRLPVDLDEYISTAPRIAAALPQSLRGLFMRLVIPFPRHEATCIVTQLLEEIDADGRLPYVFDIDAFRPVMLPADAEDAWTVADELRAVKNEVFFASLTPRALEMFR